MKKPCRKCGYKAPMGRPPKISLDALAELLRDGMSTSELAEEFGCSGQAIRNAKRKLLQKHEAETAGSESVKPETS